ncbi:MAG: TatD family hydrolase [Bacilli bacterium]|jgi:TatD DNase family protein
MIDTHCHLNHDDLYPRADFYIEEAKKAGVNTFLVVGWDVKSSEKAVDLANRFDCVYAAVGIHPTDSLKATSCDYDRIESLLQNSKVIAIGEIGLDFYWNKTIEDQKKQTENFLRQINLANKHRMPILVHSRNADQNMLEVLKRNRPICGGIMHCYSSSAEAASEYIKLGMYISLGGPVTFSNAKKPKSVASTVPLSKLFVETDSPYLSPEPFRGNINFPVNVMLVAKEIANLHNVSIETVDEITTKNFEQLFHVKTK